jgi:esterase
MHFQEMNREGADTVVLVHGMLGNLSVYYFTIAPLLAERFRVIMYDLRGHGLSEQTITGYDLLSMAEDLTALMDALGLRSVHLAGYSLGGLIALKTAIEYPDRVKRLAVIEAPDPSDSEPLEMMKAYAHNKEALREYIAGKEHGKTTVKAGTVGKRRSEKSSRLQEFLFTRTTMRENMEKERNFFYEHAIDAIPHRTKLIYGKDSDCIWAGHTLAYKINHSRLVIFEGDHGIPVQQPQLVGRQLEKFFST